jgi:hypothetical protein
VSQEHAHKCQSKTGVGGRTAAVNSRRSYGAQYPTQNTHRFFVPGQRSYLGHVAAAAMVVVAAATAAGEAMGTTGPV